MCQNDGQQMGMCMEVAGLESVEGLNIGPRVVRDGSGMRDNMHIANNGQVNQTASGCEAYGMDAD